MSLPFGGIPFSGHDGIGEYLNFMREAGKMADQIMFPQDEYPTLTRISKLHMDEFNQFMDAFKEYGEGAADELGLAGQWGDIYRKTKKLKPALWVGEDRLSRETPREILLDIIGHCFLAVDMIDRGMTGGR